MNLLSHPNCSLGVGSLHAEKRKESRDTCGVENPKGYDCPSLGLYISGAMMVEGWGEGGRDGVDQENKEIEFMSQYVQFPALNQTFQCLRYLRHSCRMPHSNLV